MTLVRGIAAAVLDVVFPPRCAGCGRAGAVLCATCLASAQAPALPLCPRCGRSLPAPASGVPPTLCTDCAGGHSPMHLDAARARAAYDGAIRNAVLALKFRGQRRVAQPLGALLTAEALRIGWRPDLVIPVPLHQRRQRGRGYNQADLLARACARQLGVPVAASLLVRARDTRPQIGLSTADRRANVAGAFALAGRAATGVLAGRRVLLVDEVYTTGSTLDAAAAAMRTGHPAAVWGLAITRPDLRAHNADAVLSPPPATGRSRHDAR